MTDSEKQKHCAGCRDDVYNHGCGGSTRCWSLDTMELVMKKEVHISQVPPWNQKARLLPSCYRKPQHVYVKPEQTN